MEGLPSKLLESYNYEIQFAAIFGGMVILFLIEGVIPRRTTEKNQTNRWLSNITLALINHFIVLFYSLSLAAVIFKYQPELPLLKAFEISDSWAFIIILLVLEFVAYWVHRVFHSIPILWRIHAVHHLDTEFDVTTSHRHHPFELLIVALITTPIIFTFGAPFIVLAYYALLHTAISLFSHSNIVIPKAIDKVLRLFIVTPDFHRMHHSSNRKFTDSNYGVILPWFDYLLKTATQKNYQEISDMELGLETFREPKDNRLDKLLITPFIYK